MSRMTALLVNRNKAPLPGIVNELENRSSNYTRTITCRQDAETETIILFFLASIGMLANTMLMITIVLKSRLRRWNQGLVFHQALVDFLRSALLLPLGISIMDCQPITKCSLLETSFLVLVTASTINLLTTVLNDSPVLPDDSEEDAIPILMDSPQCVFFGIFIIWFASITINLGPTFLSGTMAANANFRPREPSCPLVLGPYRHYILNFLWIFINLICILLTIYHLVKLYRDYSHTSEDVVRVAAMITSILQTENESEAEATENPSEALRRGDLRKLSSSMLRETEAPTEGENGYQVTYQGLSTDAADHIKQESLFHSPTKQRVLYADPDKVKSYLNHREREGVERVKMFLIVTLAYLIFWGPLFLVTLINWDWEFEQAKQSMSYEVTLHVAFVHSFVNPALFLVLHRGLREASIEILCFSWRTACTKKKIQALFKKRKPRQSATVVCSENKIFLKSCNSEDSLEVGETSGQQQN